MEFRCSNSVAGLALLTGSVALALLQPGRCAADPIEFSSSAVPLSVPHAAVQIKEKTDEKFTASQGPMDGMIDGSSMMPASQDIVLSRNKKRDPWDLNPARNSSSSEPIDPYSQALGQNPFSLFSSSSAGATNGASPFRNSNTRAWNQQENLGFRRYDNSMFNPAQANDSLTSRYGNDSQRDGAQTRETDRYGRETSGERDGIWSKIFTHESGTKERSSLTRYESSSDSMDQPSMTGSGIADHNRPAMPVGESTADTLRQSYNTGTYYAPTDAHSFRDSQGSSMAGISPLQDPSIHAGWASRSYAKPSDNRSSRVVNPPRPAILTMPKRPSDPQ